MSRELSDAERVVITGMGILSSVGTGVDAFWGNLVAGKSGVSKIEAFDTSRLPTKIAAEIKDFDPSAYMERKEAKRMDRFTQFAVAASRLALEDAKFEITADNADDVGVLIGSGIGGIITLEQQHEVQLTKGVDRVSPFFIPMMIADMASGQVSILTGAKGPNYTVVTACATGTHALGEAFHLIRRGDAKAMIAGGSEAPICEMGVGGFCASRTLCDRNDDPQRASRPFDLNRSGFVMGEGAGVLVLESLAAARERGARIYAEIIGYGLSGDAYHITSPAPGGEGAVRSIKMALRNANVKAEEIDYVNAHGTSTLLNDKNETSAIKTVLGDHAYKVAISSTKSMTGHLLGAAGAVEAAIGALAITHQEVPPTINYDTADPDCDLDYVPNQSRKTRVRTVLSNSFGFGGHNATILLKEVAD